MFKIDFRDSNRTFPGICGFELEGALEGFVEYCVRVFMEI